MANRFLLFTSLLVAVFMTSFVALGQPALPSGLAEDNDPEESAKITEPSSPSDGAEKEVKKPDDTDGVWGHDVLKDWRISGFTDHRLGPRITGHPNQEPASLAESRTQVKALKTFDSVTATIRGDLIADAVSDDRSIDFEQGRGIVDLREANLFWRPNEFLDIKAGRQILTWGTGDFVFLNDLFPKDFRSFFIGRPDTYLKAPSDAIKASFYSDIANLDLVYTPQFDPDRYLSGQRLSIFNPFTGQITGDNTPLSVTTPDQAFDQDEWALRLNKTVASHEWAIYAYDGYWKSPVSLNPSQQSLTFDRLSTYGGSLRGPLPNLSGLGNIEFSYYDSRSDQNGRQPTIPNSQWRGLIGYDVELKTNLTLGLQYYVEHIMDYDALVANAPTGQNLPNETRHLITANFQRNWPEYQITARLFAFYSPNGGDGYLRPRLDWSVTDHLSVQGGANIFFGSDKYTQFGQLDDNDNLFMTIRLGF
jgi:hypothetical protein